MSVLIVIDPYLFPTGATGLAPRRRFLIRRQGPPHRAAFVFPGRSPAPARRMRSHAHRRSQLPHSDDGSNDRTRRPEKNGREEPSWLRAPIPCSDGRGRTPRPRHAALHRPGRVHPDRGDPGRPSMGVPSPRTTRVRELRPRTKAVRSTTRATDSSRPSRSPRPGPVCHRSGGVHPRARLERPRRAAHRRVRPGRRQAARDRRPRRGPRCLQGRTKRVLVTRTVRDVVAGSELEFEDRGSHELRGLPGRWALYAARDGVGRQAEAVAAPALASHTPRRARRSVPVLSRTV